MKQRTLLITLAALGIAVAGKLLMSAYTPEQIANELVASAQTVTEPPVEFYYYGGGKVHTLTLRTDTVAVRFNPGLTEAAQADTLLRETALAPEVDWRLTNPVMDVSLVGVKDPTDPQSVIMVIDNLNAASEVYWASPLLETSPGYAHVITDEFYISVSVGTSEEDVKALNEKMGVDLVQRVDRPAIGRTGYWLRVTKAATLNSLAMANYYYEEGNLGIYGANPRFGYMYSRLAGVPDDPKYHPSVGCGEGEGEGEGEPPGQWNLARIGMEAAWDICKGNNWITVAVIDTGVDLDYTFAGLGYENYDGHPDLNANQWFSANSHGYNFLFPLDPSLFSYAVPMDDNGHGTRSAGVVAAVTNNTVGVAGVAGGWDGSPAGCRIMPIRVAQEPLNPDVGNVWQAIDFAWNNGAKVITMSIAQQSYDQFVEEAVWDAREHGCVLVSAAYNADEKNITYPGALAGVICVGATNACCDANGLPQRKYGGNTSSQWPDCNPDDQGGPNEKEWGSNWGWELDIMAPGQKFWSTDLWNYPSPFHQLNQQYGEYERTSSATPQVAGVAALIQSAMLDRGWPLLSPAQVQAILVLTATDMSYTREDPVYPDEVAWGGRDIYTGYGLLNAAAALELAVSEPPFILRDSAGKHIMSIDNSGNCIVEGRVLTHGKGMSSQLTDAYEDFVVRNESGEVLLLISEVLEVNCCTGLRGQNLYIFGAVKEKNHIGMPLPPESFVVRNANNEEVAFVAPHDDGPKGIDKGDLVIDGRLFQGTNPDPMQAIEDECY